VASWWSMNAFNDSGSEMVTVVIGASRLRVGYN